MSLTHLAMAFTLAHPAVTSAIIGPRTMEQLDGLIGCGDMRSTTDTLDRIDKLVPPGTNVRPEDDAYAGPWLRNASQRRRPA